ncbi:MAG TPA: Rieske 2Fe-2S domain-containing protein [Nocardioidaceae bacterium]|nr:Rieske 2Fe-2S domain-containing protein [Nocardioidaceae bacterium]
MWWSTLTGKLEQAESLDGTVDAVTKAVDLVLPRGPVKDALHGRWLTHPLHPLLVALPIGLFTSTSLLDLVGGDPARIAARRLVGAGVLSVAPTAAAGLADWSSLGAFRRPRRVGLVHAGANVMATLMYGGSWMARHNGHHDRGRRLALLGATALATGGYLGGHLAYSEGVGVNRNADRQQEPAEWTDAVGAAEIGEGQLSRVDVAGQPVLLARHAGELHAIGAVCSHFGGPLEQGAFEDSCVVCPWHGSRFHLTDGRVAGGPATVPQPGFEVRTLDGRVQVRART